MSIKDKFNAFSKQLEEEYKKNLAEEKKLIEDEDIIVKNIISSRSTYLFACGALILIVGISCSIAFSNWYFMLFFIPAGMFVLYKAYSVWSMIKKNNYILIKATCVSYKPDYLNFGVMKIYEFEPVDKNTCNDIIYLSINAEDTKGFNRKTSKVKLNNTYNILFKKSKEGKLDNSTFIALSKTLVQ